MLKNKSKHGFKFIIFAWIVLVVAFVFWITLVQCTKFQSCASTLMNRKLDNNDTTTLANNLMTGTVILAFWGSWCFSNSECSRPIRFQQTFHCIPLLNLLAKVDFPLLIFPLSDVSSSIMGKMSSQCKRWAALIACVYAAMVHFVYFLGSFSPNIGFLTY